MSEEIQLETNEQVPAGKPSVFGMILNPTEQFEKIKRQPKIWGAMFIVTAITFVAMWIMTLGMDVSIQNELPPEFAGDEEAIALFEQIQKITIIVTGLFTPIITVLITSVVLLLIAKIVKSPVTFKQLFSMNTHIFIISAIGALVNGIVIALFGGAPEAMPTSVAGILGLDGILGAFLNNFEVFAIWGIVLVVIGLQKVADFSKGLSIAVVVVSFLLLSSLTLLGKAAEVMLGI